jgi:hypothetical protein
MSRGLPLMTSPRSCRTRVKVRSRKLECPHRGQSCRRKPRWQGTRIGFGRSSTRVMDSVGSPRYSPTPDISPPLRAADHRSASGAPRLLCSLSATRWDYYSVEKDYFSFVPRSPRQLQPVVVDVDVFPTKPGSRHPRPSRRPRARLTYEAGEQAFTENYRSLCARSSLASRTCG